MVIPIAARVGSTAAARRAGTTLATSATPMSVATTAAIVKGSVRAHTEELAGEDAAGGQRPADADERAERDRPHGLTENHPHDAGRRRAERDADADLLRPLR